MFFFKRISGRPNKRLALFIEKMANEQGYTIQYKYSKEVIKKEQVRDKEYANTNTREETQERFEDTNRREERSEDTNTREEKSQGYKQKKKKGRGGRGTKRIKMQVNFEWLVSTVNKKG